MTRPISSSNNLCQNNASNFPCLDPVVVTLIASCPPPRMICLSALSSAGRQKLTYGFPGVIQAEFNSVWVEYTFISCNVSTSHNYLVSILTVRSTGKKQMTHPRCPVSTTCDKVSSIGAELNIRNLLCMCSLDGLDLFSRLGIEFGDFSIKMSSEDVI